MKEDFFKKIISEVKSKKLSKGHIHKLKTKYAKEFNLGRIPTNIEILMNIPDKEVPKLRKYFSSKATRTISGVSPVAVMTKPFACPHGKCIMCPGGPKSFFGNVPQSYTGHEPAAMRAARAKYSPYLQIFNRLEQYVLLGQPVDKIELIIMGGTFPAVSKKYQEEFVTECFQAMNDFSKQFFREYEIDIKKFKKFFELPAQNVKDEQRTQRLHKKIGKLKAKTNLLKEQKRNETARVRCIGLTVETRPDWGLLKHGNEMLKLGSTRVELGVQCLDDEVLKKINRGHSLQDTKDSIQILKDLGFKLNFHMMLGLPGTSREKDIEMFKKLFTEDYAPDMLKIYPCMVSKGTVLYDWMKAGKYKPITTEEAAERIAEAKRYVQKYCRIMRVQRDIPPKFMEAGVDRSNLRQYVEYVAKQKGIKCNCIRCREIGRHDSKSKAKININKYSSSGGKEFFISADTKEDALVGFARLRYPGQFLRKEITKDSALIRELHVYGAETELGEKGAQHKGTGKKLLKCAEQQAKHDGKNKIVIISGVGVRGYYKKLGYRLEGPYMVKKI